MSREYEQKGKKAETNQEFQNRGMKAYLALPIQLQGKHCVYINNSYAG